jgi:hypothetical protein
MAPPSPSAGVAVAQICDPGNDNCPVEAATAETAQAQLL